MATLHHSQQKVIQWLLVQRGLGSDPTVVDPTTKLPTGAWPVYANAEPNAPENCITVYGTTGQDDGRTFPDGDAVKHDGIQVRVRGTTEEDAAPKIEAIRDYFATQLYGEYVRVGSYSYQVPCIVKIGQRIPLGAAVPNSKRRIYTLNALTVIRERPDPLLTNILGWYRNNGTDFSGNNRTLTPVGSPTTTVGFNGAAGAAMLLSVVDHYQSNSFFISGGSAFSLSAWVYIAPGHSDLIILDEEDDSGPRLSPLVIVVGGSNYSEVSPDAANGTDDFNTAVSAGTFVHVIYTYDGGAVGKAYANGRLIGISGLTQSLPWGAFSQCNVGIGDNGTLANRMQFLGLWGRVLSDGGLTTVGQTASPGSSVARLFANTYGYDPTLAWGS